MNNLLLLALTFVLPVCVSASCPSMNCPNDSETPVVAYNFENDLSDSSGHNLHAGNNNPGCPALFYSGIGGNPGFSVDDFKHGMGCGVTFPACTLYSDEGEIEWYQYVTATPPAAINDSFYWCSSGCQYYINVYSGSDINTDQKVIQVNYTILSGGVRSLEVIGSEALIYNTWQHISFQ